MTNTLIVVVFLVLWVLLYGVGYWLVADDEDFELINVVAYPAIALLILGGACAVVAVMLLGAIAIVNIGSWDIGSW